jgi:diguanylate cyclase (GGDEF)-like protein
VESVAAAGFVCAALGLALVQAPAAGLPVAQAAALVVTYAVLARVRFAVGSGFTMPTQLACVPILLLLPPALAPALVGAGLVLSRLPDLLARAQPLERLLTSIADGWYVIGPAVLFSLVAPQGALRGTTWPVWLAALALQVVVDLVTSSVRESLGAGVAPSLQVQVIARIAVIDILLSAVGLMAAFASQARPFAFLLVLPLIASLNLFARERAARIARALALADDLAREHERLMVAQHRIGETAAASLDGAALEPLIVATAVDLVGGEKGRMTAPESLDGRAARGVGSEADDPLSRSLVAVERSTVMASGVAEVSDGDAKAIGVLIRGHDVPPRILAVARRGERFSDRDRELLATLAEQAAVCLQNLALHERVRRLAATDELTGLLNHRVLQEVLAREIRVAKRYGTPLALIMLDLDHFKQVNDRYGHQQGDAVLRSVAAVLKSSVREVDFPARYGGEELAVVLPHLDLAGAATLAERIREAVASIQVETVGGPRLSVTASIGVAALSPDLRTRQQLIAAADSALYRAKHGGRNRVELGGVEPIPVAVC